MIEPLSTPTLPRGIRARFVDNINGLRMHVLEAGFEEKGRPCLLLLHGFPELAYSWRKVMLPLAAAGYHVVAPDQRGYGRTTGWDGNYDGDLASFRMLNTVRDIARPRIGARLPLRRRRGRARLRLAGLRLVRAGAAGRFPLRHADERAVPGTACDPVRHRGRAARRRRRPARTIHDDLAALTPPRKHYHWYYSTRPANADMT